MNKEFTVLIVENGTVKEETFESVTSAMRAYRQAIIDVTSRGSFDKAPPSLEAKHRLTNGVTLLAPDYHVMMTVTIFPWEH